MNERLRAGPLHALASAMLTSGTGACDVHASVDEAIARAGESGPCDSVAAPRWVLRVQALVEPRCGRKTNAESWSHCHPLDPATSSNFPCVRIIDHEGSFVNLQYDLATGRLGPCQGGEHSDINAEWSVLPVAYLNEACEGERYVITTLGGPDSGSPEFTTARPLYYAAGDIWYIAGAGCHFTTVAVWSIDSNKCVGPVNLQSLCPLQVVPDWIQNLLPIPPYTMAVEHE
jgi:hypothetical protein